MPRSRTLRFLLAGLAVGLLGLVLLAVSVPGQSWLAQRFLASRPGWGLTVGSLSAGRGHVSVQGASWNVPGCTLNLPSVEAELSTWSLVRQRRADFSRLVAHGWTLDLSQAGSTAPSALASPAAGDALRLTLDAFQGLLPSLVLPFDVSLSGVDVSGIVILPEGRGRVAVTLRGGGLQPGSEALFPVTAKASLTSGEFATVQWEGDLKVRMDDGRSVGAVALQGDVVATGGRAPGGLRLAVAASLGRQEGKEAYAVSLWSAERPLATVRSEFDPRANGSTAAWSGTWMLDVREAELAPLALGVALPRFEVKGEGRFEADRRWEGIVARGTLEAEAAELGRWREPLATVGAVQVRGRFDLERREEVWTVRTLEATLAAGAPVAELRALQSFRLDPQTGRVQPTEPDRDLLSAQLSGLPIGWISPFLTGVTVSGGDLVGAVVARARGQGLTWRVARPLSVARLRVAEGSREWLSGLAVSVEGSGDVSPQGWQAVVNRLSFSQADAEVLLIAGKIGRLAGAAEPWRITGQVTGDLPRLLEQPILESGLKPGTGSLAAEFAASVGEKQEIQAKVSLRQLTALGASPRNFLPGVELDVRAERDAKGRVVLRVPVLVVRTDRRSELALAGSLEPRGTGWRVDGQVTGGDVFLEDIESLTTLAGTLPAATRTSGTKEPWVGWEGALDLHLRRIVPPGGVVWSNVTGTLRLGGGQMKLEGGRVSLGEGEVKVRGSLVLPDGAGGLSLAADVEAVGLNPAAIFPAAAGPTEATLDGRFDFSGRWRARGGTLAELRARSEGEVTATSRGGVFRGLPASAAAVAENSSRLSAWLASAGAALGTLTGRRGEVDIAGRAPAVAELARALHPLAYDQLSLVLSRSETGRWGLRDLALISPELRLSGTGEATEAEGEGGLALDLQLRARGRAAELLRYLGALRGEPDALGYTPSSLPVHVGGSWLQPDATELNQRLAALAVERNGLADKAAEWLNRLRGMKLASPGTK